jgi:hypothetical protein
VDRQPSAIVVIDKTQLPELIHEMTDPGPGRTDHLCQGILTYSWNNNFGSALLAETGKQQKNSSKTLLTRVEKLVDQVRLVPDIARKQMPDEQF